MKKLGFGLMRMPLLDKENDKSVDIEQVKKMVDTFINQGFTYFDTAYMYHGFSSEGIVKTVLTSRHKREEYQLATKMPTMFLKEEGDQERIFLEQLEKTGAEYFDYYLVHALDVENYATAKKLKTFEFLQEKKEKGFIKKLGFSFHDTAEVLEEILSEHSDVDFVQLQINYLDWEDKGIQSRRCYEVAKKYGKQIIVMEPVKGGQLAQVPNSAKEIFSSLHNDWSVASWAIKFCASLENVFMVLSGMSNLEQLNDNISFMKDFVPLNREEIDACFKVRDILDNPNLVPCTNCRYCIEGDACPKKIPIPNYFNLYNKQIQGNDMVKEYQEYISGGYGKAKECIECKQCERACPQKISICEWLKKVSKKFD